MHGFRAPMLAAVPDPLTASDHRNLAGSAADTARRHLIDAARHCDKAGDVLGAHRARAAVVNIDELLDELANRQGAA